MALPAARAGLGKEAFAAAWEEGLTLTGKQARQYSQGLSLAIPDVYKRISSSSYL